MGKFWDLIHPLSQVIEATCPTKRSDQNEDVTHSFQRTLLLHLLAILLFTIGFLLSRTELPYHSHCSHVHVSHSPCFSSNNNRSCWTKPTANLLYMIITSGVKEMEEYGSVMKYSNVSSGVTKNEPTWKLGHFLVKKIDFFWFIGLGYRIVWIWSFSDSYSFLYFGTIFSKEHSQ